MRACLAHSVLAVLVVSMLGIFAAPRAFFATAAAESSGDWQITQETDSVTGAKLIRIFIYSHKLSHSPQNSSPHAVMQLACVKGQPVVQFIFGFQIGSKADCEMSYRVDDHAENNVEPRILRGLSVAVIETKAEVAEFLKELAPANLLYVVISSMAEGRTSAEFRVTGAQAAIDALSAGCPSKPKK